MNEKEGYVLSLWKLVNIHVGVEVCEHMVFHVNVTVTYTEPYTNCDDKQRSNINNNAN